jgi:hypothetical protein
LFPRSAADVGTHGGIGAESVGVIEILVPDQRPVDRLPQQGGSGMLSIPAGSTVSLFTRSGAGQFEGVLEFTIGPESGIAGDHDVEESEPETAVGLGY